MKKVLLLVITILLLSFTALAQGTHSNTLTWTNPAVATGNKVYRGTTQGGPYTVIFTSATPILTYVDANLGPQVTFYYVVTDTCSTCNVTESSFSNEIKLTTLNDKPAPPVLSGTSN